MAVSICAFNSRELNEQALIDEGLNLFVKLELSDMFNDLLLSRDTAIYDELGVFDQVANVLQMDIESIFKMSNYWDKEEELEHLLILNDEAVKANQLEIIQKNNDNLLGNIEQVHETLQKLESGIRITEDLKYLLEDLLKMIEFIDFVKPLAADTVYFKFKTSYNQAQK